MEVVRFMKNRPGNGKGFSLQGPKSPYEKKQKKSSEVHQGDALCRYLCGDVTKPSLL